MSKLQAPRVSVGLIVTFQMISPARGARFTRRILRPPAISHLLEWAWLQPPRSATLTLLTYSPIILAIIPITT